MRLALAFCFLVSPGALQAQEIALDEAIVRACFESTPAGVQAPSCAGQATRDCQQALTGKGIYALASCVGEEAIIWERLESEMLRELSFVLADIEQTGIENATDRTDALQTSQRVYIQFWDAECRFRRALFQGRAADYDKVSAGAACTLEFAARRSLQLRDLLRALQ